MQNDHSIGLVLKIMADGSQALQETEKFRASFIAAVKQSEAGMGGFYNVLTQVRIGLTQLGRGDVGGIPNLIKAAQLFKAEGGNLNNVLKVLDAALLSFGAEATKAKDVFEEFAGRIKIAASGTSAEAKLLKETFTNAGIGIEQALIQPDKAFRQLLTNFATTKAGSIEARAAMDLLGIGEGKVAEGAKLAGQSLEGLKTQISGSAVAAGVAGAAIVAAVVAVAAAIEVVKSSIEKLSEVSKKVGTDDKEDFEKYAKAIALAGDQVTTLDRALGQDLTRSLDLVNGSFDRFGLEFLRTAGPGAISLLKEIARVLNDLMPIISIVGQSLNLAFRGAVFAIEIVRQTVKNLKNDLIDLFNNPSIVTLSRILITNIAIAGANLPKDTTPTATGFKGKGGGGSKGRDDISELELQVRLLRSKQEEATRDLNGTREAASRLFDVTQQLIEAERQQAAAFPENEKAAKLEELRQKQLESLKKYSEALEKVSEGELKAMESLAKRINEENVAAQKLAKESDDYIREQYRTETDAYQRRAELQQQYHSTFYNNRQQAIQSLAALDIDAEERHFERLKEDLEREIEFLAEGDERRQAVIDRLAAEESEKNARIALIRRQAAIDLEREQPNSDRNVLGDDIADALNKLEIVNIIVGAQTTVWDRIGVAMDTYAQRLRETIPSATQLAVKSLQTLASATTSALAAFMTGRSSLRQAVAGIVTAMLEPYKQYCEVKAAMHFAEAAANFAYGNIGAGIKHTAVGGLWVGAGALIGAAGQFIAGSGAGAQGAAGSQSATGSALNPAPYAVQRNSQVALGQQAAAQQQAEITKIGFNFDNATRRLNETADKLQTAHERLQSMPAGHVVGVGLAENPQAAGVAVIQTANGDAGFTENLGRSLRLR